MSKEKEKEREGGKIWSLLRLRDLKLVNKVTYTKESFNNKGNGNQDFSAADVLSASQRSNNNNNKTSSDNKNQTSSDKNNVDSGKPNQISSHADIKHAPNRPVAQQRPPRPTATTTSPPSDSDIEDSDDGDTDDSDIEDSDDGDDSDIEDSDDGDTDDSDSDDDEAKYHVHVFLQRLCGGKIVTTIRGINRDYYKILRHLKEECRCNGRVVMDPEFGKVIELCGDRRNIVADFLLEVHLVRKRHLRVHRFIH